MGGGRKRAFKQIRNGGGAGKRLADIVKLAQTLTKEKKNTNSLSAYLLNMAIRLLPMKRALKDTGSIFLHCDPTASHYLKLIMDAIFGHKNFRNEIVWCYHGPGSPKMRQFNRKTDHIFWYANGNKKWTFNQGDARVPYKDPKQTLRKAMSVTGSFTVEEAEAQRNKGKILENWWVIRIAARSKKEYLGYPTQKPLDLLRRIIKACSNEGDLVLDPFCGCGTTIHVAEELKRKWIGIDISKFSTGLVRERLVNNFQHRIDSTDIEIRGTPHDLSEAQALADKDKFEFEKWVCGEIGAHGMFHDPGERGSDGGVDGVIEFGLFENWGKSVEKSYAIVQVKGGHVTADSVRALYTTVKRFNAKAGIFVCFDKYMRTVENNRVKCTYKDMQGIYPVIQGFSVERLLNGEKPELPPLIAKEGGKMKDTSSLFADH